MKIKYIYNQNAEISNSKMAKSTLEKLLLEASSFTQKIEKQAEINNESVIKTAIKEEVSKFIKEATEEEDEDMDFDETTTDTETDTEDLDTSDDEGEETEDTTDLDTDDEDMSFGDDEESLGDDEMSDESDALDISVGMNDEMGGTENAMDLSNLTMDELKSSIEDLVANMGDNETIEFVKKPSFQVNKKPSMGTRVGAGMGMTNGVGGIGGMATLDAEDDDDTEMEFDLDDESEDMGSDEMGMEDEGTEDFEGSEDEGDDLDEHFKYSKENLSTGGVDAPFAEKVKGSKKFNPDKTFKGTHKVRNGFSKGVVGAGYHTHNDDNDNDNDFDNDGDADFGSIDECQDESVYEQTVKENRQLKGTLKKLALEVKGYKVREAKAESFIKESMSKLQSLALTNTNLAYFVRLVNEHATSAKEKENMLQKFDAAKTVRESQLTFNMLKESLTKRPLIKPLVTKTDIKEVKSATSGKTLIKEEKAYISKEQQRMNELFNYKPTY